MPQHNKVVFLDRDGVLCEDTDYVTSFEKLHIYGFASEAIEYIHKAGYMAIVVTNQSGVARGMMTEETVRKLNDYLKKVTGVDAIYYCPHLPPEKGIGQQSPYRIFCNCRKPDIGMLQHAAKDYDIVFQESYMVGDRETDMEAGRRAGLQTVCITGDSAAERKSSLTDIYFKNVLEFAQSLQKGMVL